MVPKFASLPRVWSDAICNFIFFTGRLRTPRAMTWTSLCAIALLTALFQLRTPRATTWTSLCATALLTALFQLRTPRATTWTSLCATALFAALFQLQARLAPGQHGPWAQRRRRPVRSARRRATEEVVCAWSFVRLVKKERENWQLPNQRKPQHQRTGCPFTRCK